MTYMSYQAGKWRSSLVLCFSHPSTHELGANLVAHFRLLFVRVKLEMQNPYREGLLIF